jgi:uncharacterized protein (DUF58 family)
VDRDEELLSQEEMVTKVNTEVKRVSDLFRFILKYKEHFQPSGVEFSGLRQYLPSDDASRISWKISASKPDLFVKEYDEDKDMDVFIVLDASETMLFGTADKLKSEYAAVVAASLAYASVSAGINVGFLMQGSEQVFLAPDGGQVQYQKILREVTDYSKYGERFDLEDAMDSTVGQVKENTAVFLISDFIDTDGDWKKKLRLSSIKFRHTLSIMIRDLRDYKLPKAGNVRFESPTGGGQQVALTDKVREKFEEEARQQERDVEERVKSAGSGFIKIDTRDSFSAEFAEYFDSSESDW